MSAKRQRSYKRACKGKRRYRSKQEALLAARTVAARSSRAKTPHRAYECGACRGWHLTSQER